MQTVVLFLLIHLLSLTLLFYQISSTEYSSVLYFYYMSSITFFFFNYASSSLPYIHQLTTALPFISFSCPAGFISSTQLPGSFISSIRLSQHSLPTVPNIYTPHLPKRYIPFYCILINLLYLPLSSLVASVSQYSLHKASTHHACPYSMSPFYCTLINGLYFPFSAFSPLLASIPASVSQCSLLLNIYCSRLSKPHIPFYCTLISLLYLPLSPSVSWKLHFQHASLSTYPLQTTCPHLLHKHKLPL